MKTVHHLWAQLFKKKVTAEELGQYLALLHWEICSPETLDRALEQVGVVVRRLLPDLPVLHRAVEQTVNLNDAARDSANTEWFIFGLWVFSERLSHALGGQVALRNDILASFYKAVAEGLVSTGFKRSNLPAFENGVRARSAEYYAAWQNTAGLGPVHWLVKALALNLFLAAKSGAERLSPELLENRVTAEVAMGGEWGVMVTLHFIPTVTGHMRACGDLIKEFLEEHDIVS